jgi:cell fate (sporulation/competence/biofilm development) regulator YlbF (YheA/YmcA/DUF963 family)
MMSAMSIAENKTIDMGALLMRACELGEMINRSVETAEYLYWKQQVELNKEVQELVKQFARAKERLSECERFGRFHPDYNEALDHVKQLERRMNEFEEVRNFKRAEQTLDELLHDISLLIARAVSDSIKVPSNDPNPKGCNCSSGGGCASCG